LDIDSSDTKSPIGYGYVLTLDESFLSWKYVKKLLFCHDLLCKHKLFHLFNASWQSNCYIFKVFSKNVNEIDIWEWETNIL